MYDALICISTTGIHSYLEWGPENEAGSGDPSLLPVLEFSV